MNNKSIRTMLVEFCFLWFAIMKRRDILFFNLFDYVLDSVCQSIPLGFAICGTYEP